MTEEIKAVELEDDALEGVAGGQNEKKRPLTNYDTQCNVLWLFECKNGQTEHKVCKNCKHWTINPNARFRNEEGWCEVQ